MQAGLDFRALRRQAATRDFRPVSTGITLDLRFRNTLQHLRSENVVGIVRGEDKVLDKEYIAYSAHWDHLGIGPAVNGDSIYNGALDNASGVADLLAVARAAAASPRARRSQLFIFVTAEESGLLGSAYFAENATVPVTQIVANLSPEQHPEAGSFYRSDHFSFAKAGVPAVSIGAGTDVVGRPKDWGIAQADDYTSHRYHQPSDAYRPDFDLTGAAQLATIVHRFGTLLANAPKVPTWNKDAEFRSPRVATQP